MRLPFAFPNPAGGPDAVSWEQGVFRYGDCSTTVLKYAVGDSGWNEDLTSLHEESTSADHFMAVASRRHAIERLNHWLPQEAIVLEIGCSSGHLLQDLQVLRPSLNLIGSDFIVEPLERLSNLLPSVPFIQFDLTQCPLPDECVDGIISLNVLEHIEDDVKAIQQMFRIVVPGGYCIIEVPAGP
ncbi:MAG: class I SAM-dependent methyltransferase, partial [Bryobacteraceae bacterium]|nr:class I SAM-dependent methyltransferase [Bryobacteraceae bacterium]